MYIQVYIERLYVASKGLRAPELGVLVCMNHMSYRQD